MSSAYLLISHGSRDPRPQQAMEELAELVRIRVGEHDSGRAREHESMRVRQWESIRVGEGEKSLVSSQEAVNNTLPIPPCPHPPILLSPPHRLTYQANRFLQLPETKQATGTGAVVSNARYPLVGTATLELAYAPLHEQIRQFASVAIAKGCNHLQLLPLFLLPGVHVREDIPKEVALAQQGLGEAVGLKLQSHIGAHPGLGRLFASQWAMVEADAKILLSHGSRRAGGNEPVEAVAEQLGAVAAYWSVQPMLEEQIRSLAAAGHKHIGILPYFLFPGGITDAIAQKVDSLQVQFPSVQLRLGEPIGASATLANLIVDLIE